MTTVILAEKPSQARSYVQAFQKSTKKQGYYTVSDPVLPENTLVTYGRAWLGFSAKITVVMFVHSL